MPGIEITAVVDGADVHALGYFIDVHAPRLLAFLAEQRRQRIDRVRQIIDRLASCAVVLDPDAISFNPASTIRGSRSAGHGSRGRWWRAVASPTATRRSRAGSGEGAPLSCHAWGRCQRSRRPHPRAGGAHRWRIRGSSGDDEWLPGLLADGLDALEAYHSNHDPRRPTITSRRPPGLVWSSQVDPTITPTRRTRGRSGQRLAAAGGIRETGSPEVRYDDVGSPALRLISYQLSAISYQLVSGSRQLPAPSWSRQARFKAAQLKAAES